MTWSCFGFGLEIHSGRLVVVDLKYSVTVLVCQWSHIHNKSVFEILQSQHSGYFFRKSISITFCYRGFFRLLSALALKTVGWQKLSIKTLKRKTRLKCPFKKNKYLFYSDSKKTLPDPLHRTRGRVILIGFS